MSAAEPKSPVPLPTVGAPPAATMGHSTRGAAADSAAMAGVASARSSSGTVAAAAAACSAARAARRTCIYLYFLFTVGII